MNLSWQVATIRGIPIRVHITHLLLLAYVAFEVARGFTFDYAYLIQQFGIAPRPLLLPHAFWGIAIALGLFVSIVLHELAHSMVALASGVRVQSITLMALGGVSQMELQYMTPGREAWMAFAGPLTSFAIGAIFLVTTLALPGHPGDLTAAGLLFAQINLMLAVFNLLPAFPMDGGRLLRAALTPWLGRLRATRTAAVVGKVMAGLFVLAAIVTRNPILILIGVFIVLGASAETAMVEAQTLLAGRRVGEFADPRIGGVTAETPLAEVVERMRAGKLVAVRVGDGVNGPGAGYITLADLKRLGSNIGSRRAGDVARRNILRVWDSTDAAAVAAVLPSRGKEAIVVDPENGEPIGLVTSADLARVMSGNEVPEELRGPGAAIT